jgi:hypothetical protein
MNRFCLKFLSLFTLTSILFACKEQDDSIKLRIEYASNYSCNLNQRTMTVHFRTKPDSIVKFNLSKIELQSIIEKYHALHLDTFKSGNELQELDGFPVVPITLKVDSKSSFQELSFYKNRIGLDQDKNEKSERLNTFFQYVDSILSAKPEIQKSKISDIYYL